MKHFFFIALIFSLTACTTSLDTSLEGTWKLEKIEQKTDSTWVISDWMKGGEGTLIYSNDGYMSVHFIPQDYLTHPEETYWYVASYDYDKSNHAVHHKRLLHSDPSEVGKEVTRQITIVGNQMFMFADEFGLRLTWNKVRE